MTRINAAIHPEELLSKHLIAEHREIVRIPNVVRKQLSENKDILTDIPKQFSLGTGHVKFFRNKLGYLKQRYTSLYIECVKRGIHVTPMHSAFNNLPTFVMGEWKETDRERSKLLFNKGFEKAQSLNDKKFSLEDMVGFISYYESTALLAFDSTGENHGLSIKQIAEKYIATISHPKVFDIEIEVESYTPHEISDIDEEDYLLHPKITNNQIKITKNLC